MARPPHGRRRSCQAPAAATGGCPWTATLRLAQAPAVLTESPAGIPARSARALARPGSPLDERVDDLLGRMTLEEKIGQLYGGWVGVPSTGEDMAPHQHELRRRHARLEGADPPRARPAHPPVRHRAGRAGARRQGAGPHAGRDRGRQPVRHPGDRARGVPDRLHDLAGHRVPDAAGLGRHLRRRAGRADGRADRRRRCAASASTRDSRRCSTSPATRAGAAPRRPSARTRTWSPRVGTAYVRGLESAGVIATLKHFVGYSALAGRPQLRPGRHRPARAGRRASCRRSRWRCATAGPAR